VVEEEIRKLIDEKKVLEKAIHAGDSTLDQNVAEGKKLEQVQEALKQSSRLHRDDLSYLLRKDLDAYSGLGQWIEAVAELLVNSSFINIDRDADFVAKLDAGSSQSTAQAAENNDDVHQNTPPTLGKEERKTIIKLLFDEIVTIVPEDWKGTALGWIAANGLKSVVRLHQQVQETRLFATGSKPIISYKEPDGKVTYKSGKTSCERLESRGIDEKDESGRTPLSYAAGGGHEDIVEILLDGRAFIDSKDRESRTPLSHAARSGHKDVVRLLLDRGADRRLADEDFDTPRQLPMPRPKPKRHTYVVNEMATKQYKEERRRSFLDRISHD